MTYVERPVRIAGGILGQYRHICGLFAEPDEEYRVLLPYLKDGLEAGHKLFQIVDVRRVGDHLRRLEAGGIDVTAARRDGRLDVRVWEDTYLRGGRFDTEAMLGGLEALLTQAHADGFPLLRATGHMEWALGYRSGLDELLEYEARVNYLSARYPDPLVCLYDLTQFNAGVIVDVLRTHPMAILGGVLQLNPFFVPPDEFLRQRRERAA